MKNQNKVRHIPYGRKTLHFENVEDAARFLNLYRDLFVDDVEWSEYVNTDKFCYRLRFYMNHEDWNRVKEDLKIKRRTITVHDDYFGDYKRNCSVYVG
jgi:hypothetical protein